MRLDSNSVNLSIDEINEKIEYMKYLIDTRMDEINRNIALEMQKGIKNYHDKMIDNLKKTII